VDWKVERFVTGALPLRLAKGSYENSKDYLVIERVTGDVESFKLEVELVVGPLYTVQTNLVRSTVEIHSTTLSKVDEELVNKVKQWMIKIGL